MQNNFQKQKKKINSTAIGLAAVGLIIVGAIAWFTPWVHLDNSPKSLGDRLEYIGKFDYGCGGFIGVCDAAPGATYFYATDMSLEEVMGYFRGARTRGEPTIEFSTEDEGARYRISYTNKEGSKNGFYIVFYDNGSLTAQQYNLKSTNKKHVIEIDFKAYPNAKSAL